MRTVGRWLAIGVFALGLSACDKDEPPSGGERCGDNFCGEGETIDNCYADCGSCGDGLCSALGGETLESCPTDCGACGDGVCSEGESAQSCYADCGSCGDGLCTPEGGEDIDSCLDDCGICGDGICGTSENATSCHADCGSCGDDICSGDEDATNCASDCEPSTLCTAVYNVVTTSHVTRTPFGAGDGEYDQAQSQLVLRYEAELDSTVPMDGGRVDLLHLWYFTQVDVQTPVAVRTEVMNYTGTCNGHESFDAEDLTAMPSTCNESADDVSVAFAQGRWHASVEVDGETQTERVVWASCTPPEQYGSTVAGAYQSEHEAVGPGCLNRFNNAGNIHCTGSLCSAGNLQSGNNLQNNIYNQPLEAFFLRDGGQQVELRQTHVPSVQPTVSYLSLTGERMLLSCD